jgi:hypothetical protein
MKRVVTAFALSTLFTLPAAADTLDQVNLLTQADFRLLSEDLGSALSYKALLPAAPLGVTGFDVGVELSVTGLESAAVLQKASSDDTPSKFVVPKLHLHKGLPLGIDIGAFYTAVPDTDISLWGAELRYAVVQGGVATPAVGVRGTYTKLSGIDQLELDTRGLELTISKGFANFTPYAGIGRVWVSSTPIGVPGIGAEDFGQNKVYVGGNFNFGLINVALEGDQTGEATSYGVKFGWRF